MKNKKIITIISAIIMAFCCVNMPVYAVNSTSTETVTQITVENSQQLWERFLKYDLRITDYNSLSEEEKDLCKFIFETELNSEDTIICERARRTLAGYDVGKRIDPNQVENYCNIVDRCSDYWASTVYPNSDNNGIESFREQYEVLKNCSTLDVVPDIKHIDEDNYYNEYWIDDERTSAIEIYNNSYYNFDKEPFIYKVYNDDSYEKYEIEKNFNPLPTIEYEGCKYQICSDNTLAFYSLNDKTLTSVEIPETIDGMEVTGIKMFAFDESNIVSVHLPKTISYIEPFAFYKCENLCNINFPESLKSIGGSGFCECNSLGDINIDCPNFIFSRYSFYNCSVNNVTLNTKVVPDFVTGFFVKYKSLTLGNNVKEIGYNLLNENIEIPENVKIITWGVISDDVITIPKNIEILGAYNEAKGNMHHSVSIGGDAEIPLIENKSMTELFDSTIMGYYGTEAHNYALAHNAKFIPLDNLTYGDVNNDGNINIADIVSLQNYLFGNDSVGYEADTNRDGKIDIFDMVILRKQIIENNK